MKIAVSGLLRRVVWWKSADVSEVLAASIINALMMKAQQPRRQPSN
jgi:hypothetical protein